MSEIIGIVLALLKAIPVLDSWFKQLASAYFEMKLKQHDDAFVGAYRVLIQSHDQRKLEEAIGSGNAGKPATRRDDVETRPRGGGAV